MVHSVCLFLSLVATQLVSQQDGELERETALLISQLQDVDSDAGPIIARLAEIGFEARDASPLLKQIVVDQNDYSSRAAGALTAICGEMPAQVTELLESKDQNVVTDVLLAFRQHGCDLSPVLDSIVKCVLHPVKSSRRHAIETIGATACVPDVTVPLLQKFLEGKHKWDTVHCCDALEEMGPIAGEAVPALEKLSQEHPDAYVRCRALSALVAIDSSQQVAVRALAAQLDNRQTYGRIYSTSVRSIAVSYLASMGENANAAKAELLKLFADPEIRKNQYLYADTVQCLASINATEALPQLIEHMTHELKLEQDDSSPPMDALPATYASTCIRAIAASGILALKENDTLAVETLLAILGDKQWKVTERAGSNGATLMDPRAEAAAALANVSGDTEPIVEALKEAFTATESQSSCLCSQATWALLCLDSNKDEYIKQIAQSLSLENESRRSVFHRESGDTVFSVIGDGFGMVEKRILELALVEDGSKQEFVIDLVARAERINELTNLGFTVIKHPKSIDIEHGFFDVQPGRETASMMFSKVGKRLEPAITVLIDHLDSECHQARAEAARLLGIIGKKPELVVPALTKRLHDKRVIVRVRSILALGQFGHEARSALMEINGLEDDKYRVVRDAVHEVIPKIKG